MASDRFTLLELTDLALCYPEAGAVNFNILHTVLSRLIREMKLDGLKTPCHLEDEALAQTFVTKRRMDDNSGIRKLPEKVFDVQELRQKRKEFEERVESGKKVLPSASVIDEGTGAFEFPDEEDALEMDLPKALEEMWRATNVHRRMEAAETGIKQIAELVDDIFNKVEDVEETMTETLDLCGSIAQWQDRFEKLEDDCKRLDQRIKDSNEQKTSEIESLENLINDIAKDHRETKSALDGLAKRHNDLAERVAYKSELEDLKEQMSEVLKSRLKEVKKIIREVEDTLVKKDDFMEVVTRIEVLEANKVDRGELGRLLEPGFIDTFMEEQVNLRTELEGLKETVSKLEVNLEVLCIKIDDDVIKVMETNFEQADATLDTIKAKLALLDPDEINDSFANVEEQADMIIKEVEKIKLAAEELQKEAKMNFNKISNVNELLNRLDQEKADKVKMYELLEMKVDLDVLMDKIDRSEFFSVVGDMNQNLERLTITVKINEEEMKHNFTDVNHELALKMYTEDFITATGPIRNRIKALMIELEGVKQIALTHLFPDAPGVVKCISCNRGAHLAGPKYLGDANLELLQEVPAGMRTHLAFGKLVKNSDEDSQEASSVRLPADDLDSVPIPSPDKPREQNPRRLPLLFATARPQIGLVHEKRRSTIDKELVAYFATRPVRPCDGEHTRTLPQQRGVDFTAVKLRPQEEKEEILLEGLDKRMYRGAIYDGVVSELPPGGVAEDDDLVESRPCPTKESDSAMALSPTVVSLHVDDQPLQKAALFPKSSQIVLLPGRPFDRTLPPKDLKKILCSHKKE